jgi:hypothetical protein
MDENSTKMVAPLFSAQPCVEAVEFKPGIESYHCGGQPWHFDLGSKDIPEGATIYHLGLRSFPVRQLTMQCLEDCKLPVTIEINKLATECSLFVDGADATTKLFTPTVNRAVIHGQPVCTHNRQTPQLWKFLSGISDYLKSDFDEVVFVGSERDREVGERLYPDWKGFDDKGSFLELARLIQNSRLVIGTGSSVSALGGAMKVPTIRVHDPIGAHPKVIWSNLGDNQLNETEVELRESWPKFRDKILTGARV